MEIAGENINTFSIDHHALVAAPCQDLKTAERINHRLDKKGPRRVVSARTVVVAMILNRLDFTNRCLYLTHKFFESKLIEHLLGEAVSAHQLDDHTLGKALDKISNYVSSRLFGEVAFEIALGNKLLNSLLP